MLLRGFFLFFPWGKCKMAGKWGSREWLSFLPPKGKVKQFPHPSPRKTMAIFSFTCAKCGRVLQAQEEWIGKTTLCPFCPSQVPIQPPQQGGQDAGKNPSFQKQEEAVNVAPQAEASKPQKPATRWPRFFARWLDWTLYMLLSPLYSLVLGLLLLPVVSFGEEVMNEASEGLDIFFIILAVIFGWLFLFFLDAIVYALFGNTLGKKLMGIQVLEADGRKVSRSRYFRRNLQVFLEGYALGIPPLFLISFIWQSERVYRGKPATYDARLGFQVVSNGKSYVGFFVVVWIILMFLLGKVLPFLGK